MNATNHHDFHSTFNQEEDPGQRRKISNPNPPINMLQQQKHKQPETVRGSSTLCFTKVVKGEIHNILSLMRTDPKYASPLRFTSEIVSYPTEESVRHHHSSLQAKTVHTNVMNSKLQSQLDFQDEDRERDDNNTMTLGLTSSSYSLSESFPMSSLEKGEHPIITSLRQLNEYLTRLDNVPIEEEPQQHQKQEGVFDHLVKEINFSTWFHNTQEQFPDGNYSRKTKKTTRRNYTRNNSKSIHISSLMFLSPFCTIISSKDISALVTGAALSAVHKFLLYGFVDPTFVTDAKEGITIIARSIRHCRFEAGSGHPQSRTKVLQTVAPSASAYSSTNKMKKSRISTVSSFITDEQVVLKLLTLASLVIRSTSGDLLLDSDIVGIFDTCLFVATQNENEASELLKSAAGDCLSGIVLVIFGQFSKSLYPSHTLHSYMEPTEDQEKEEESMSTSSHGSDDLWGNTDPSDTSSNELNTIIATTSMEGLTRPVIVQSLSLHPQEYCPTIPSTSDPTIGNTYDCQNNHVNTNPATLSVSTSPSSTSSRFQQLNRSFESQTKHQIQPDDILITPALVTIMSRLTSLCNPLYNSDETCILGLQLVNIALETASTCRLTQYPELLNILQNDLCKHLLLLSTTADLIILTQTLRIIFNLFNSIKHHLKVQLEVFLTSVHLRILDSNVKLNRNMFSYEQREIALESLLEFCNEPALMMDLFLNYDCDVKCTNLFDSVCTVLVDVANDRIIEKRSLNHDSIAAEGEMDHPLLFAGQGEVLNDLEPLFIPSDENFQLNTLNKLACQGLLSIIESIARKCPSNIKFPYPLADGTIGTEAKALSQGHQNNHSPANYPHGVEELSIHHSDEPSKMSNFLHSTSKQGKDPTSVQHLHSGKNFMFRKRQKVRLEQVASQFNRKPTGKEWIKTAQEYDILPSPLTPKSVASFLYTVPNLEKAQIGLYLSKGPHDKYPFHAEVLEAFTKLYDFSGLSFSDSLRLYLSKFRLPGEAQCIDRIMEAYAKALFQMPGPPTLPMINADDTTTNSCQLALQETMSPKNNSSTSNTDNISSFPFKSADAAFILSFSTIMLNTDLHNPTISDDRRMTVDQFIRNNRGINDGQDFHDQFLVDLYDSIYHHEIQVQQPIDLFRADGNLHLDGLFSKAEIMTPFFTSLYDATNASALASFHERDMFVSISQRVAQSLFIVFVRSRDDSFYMKALLGLKQMALISVYFSFEYMFNQIVDALLLLGNDFIINNMMVATPEFVCSKNTLSNEMRSNVMSPSSKGLLSLDVAFQLIRIGPELLNQAWPGLIDVALSLRDCNSIPSHLSDLDDFADNQGDLLPPSEYSMSAHSRAFKLMSDGFHRERPDSGILGTFSSFFQSKKNEEYFSSVYRVESVRNSTSFAAFVSPLISSSRSSLLAIVQSSQLDLILIGKKDKNTVKKRIQSLLDFCTDSDLYGPSEVDVFEYHATFALELAARSLFSNHDCALDLYPMFLSKFEALLKSTGATEGSLATYSQPYLIERVVVTILRSCIHMMDVEPMKPMLKSSLFMLLKIPSIFLHQIADRLGCGLAIVLKGYSSALDTVEECSLFSDLINLVSNFPTGRPFIFDGIAYCVDALFSSSTIVDNTCCTSTISSNCACMLLSFLLTFVDGNHKGDDPLAIDSVKYLEKLYEYLFTLIETRKSPLSENDHWWLRISQSLLHASLTDGPNLSKQSFESLEKFLLSASSDTVMSHDDSLAMIDNMVAYFPPVTKLHARIKMLDLLCSFLLQVIPSLSKVTENCEALADSIRALVKFSRQNFQWRKNHILFETTLERLANVTNVMSLNGYCENEKFCRWSVGMLCHEIEKVGEGERICKLVKDRKSMMVV